jgi:integrase
MPRRLELTYHRNTQQWKKVYHGKAYYLGKGKSKSDMASYERALTKWETLIEELREQERQAGIQAAANARQNQQVGLATNYGPYLSQSGGPPTPKGDRTVQQAIELFLLHKREQTEDGEVSIGRYDTIRCYLDDFKGYVGPTTLVNKIDANMLAGYRSVMRSANNAGTIATATVKNRMQIAKQFIRFCWSRELIDRLPRNIDSKELAVRSSPIKVKAYSVAEAKMIFEMASRRTKLYIALALNCCFLQKDMGDLDNADVDWENGVITRKRSKTAQHESVPTVSYKLWSVTFELLKEFRASTTGKVLQSEKGTPLWTERLAADGKNHKTDLISSSWKRHITKLKKRGLLSKNDKRTFKSLRKTSPSLLESADGAAAGFDNGNLASLMLGHSPNSIKDRHYIQIDRNKLDRALDWLDQQYDLRLD